MSDITSIDWPDLVEVEPDTATPPADVADDSDEDGGQ